MEVKQILKALVAQGGWRYHPATLMWEGYESALAQYGLECCQEWLRRGYRDTTMPSFIEMASPEAPRPPWFGRDDFHRAHQSNLIRKKPEFYRPIFGSEVPDDLPYLWPKSGLVVDSALK